MDGQITPVNSESSNTESTAIAPRSDTTDVPMQGPLNIIVSGALSEIIHSIIIFCELYDQKKSSAKQVAILLSNIVLQILPLFFSHVGALIGTWVCPIYGTFIGKLIGKYIGNILRNLAADYIGRQLSRMIKKHVETL